MNKLLEKFKQKAIRLKNKLKDRAIRLKNKTVENIKALGWVRGVICGFIALSLTLMPSIVFMVAYILTGNLTWLGSATGWVTLIIAPAGGTGTLLFFSFFLGTTTIMIKLLRR